MLRGVETEENLEIMVDNYFITLHAGLQLSNQSPSELPEDKYKNMKGAENISVHSTCQTVRDMLCHLLAFLYENLGRMQEKTT